MKTKFKNILQNSIIVFIVWFILLAILSFSETYDLYKGGVIEKNSINLMFPLHYSLMLLLFIVPIMFILEAIKIKNWMRIIITLVITAVIATIYVLSNINIQF